MGRIEGQRQPHFLAPDGTGSSSSGYSHDQLTASFHALTEHYSSPEIFALVSVLYDTYMVQRHLEAAAQGEPENPLHKSSISSSLERFRSSVHFDPPLPERYRRASLFAEAAVHIMRGSFTAYPEDPVYLRAAINTAYEPYGFQVTEGKGEIDVSAGPSLWHDRLIKQINQYADSRKVAMTPYQTLHFQIDHAYEWKPVGQWKEEPEVLSLTEQMNRIRHVHLKLFDLKEDNWFRSHRTEEKATHIAGLHPYYKERYSKAGYILKNVAEGVLQDGLSNDQFNWLHALAYEFNEALYDFDLHLDVNPEWTPEQALPRIPEGSPVKITHIEEVEE